MSEPNAALPSGVPAAAATTAAPSARLRDLTAEQWKTGVAAWLGWLFDGLDIHLYTLVATPFVAQLLAVDRKDALARDCSSLIQAAFMFGWALGGGVFGRIGDRIGRARALMLTILTYALCTGLSCCATAWWHLLVFRFLAALGVGGEWAVGAALLAETWPRSWRLWIAAVLQTGVNCGIVLAMGAGYALSNLPFRYLFLVGILPALLVVWIRRAVPEPAQWRAAKQTARHHEPGLLDLFRGPVRRITLLTLLVCGFSLSGHWAFMYWFVQSLRNLPELAAWGDARVTQLASLAMILVVGISSVGNFLAAGIARRLGYRRTIALMCAGYFLAMCWAYSTPRDHAGLLWWLVPIGLSQGVFALFTMYLPPLFPTLLRTTGAGFCYNIGRVAAGAAIVFFGFFAHIGDYRLVLYSASYLFLPAAAVALFLPEPDESAARESMPV
jgi:MFS family permease